MDNWGALLFLVFIAWLAETIASARRRRRQQTRARRPLPPPTVPDSDETAEPEAREPVDVRRPMRREWPPPRPAELEPQRDPWLDQQQVPEPEPLVFPPELVILREADTAPRSTEPRALPDPAPPSRPERPTAVSLETLEPSGRESHKEFHDKYIGELSEPQGARREGRLQRADARRGIILAEILGPPLSER